MYDISHLPYNFVKFNVEAWFKKYMSKAGERKLKRLLDPTESKILAIRREMISIID